MVEPSPLKLKTPLGEALLFQSVSASEELGRLFEFHVRALAELDVDVDLAKLLGKPASVSIEMPSGEPRYLHGLVASAGLDGASGKRVGYQLLLRPWLWLLTRRADTRIFQKQTVVDILKTVFEPYQGDVAFELSGSFPTYDYCVQYRETDFNFVSRLMEQEGIYYFFRHSAARHTLVIVNKMSAHVAFPGHAEMLFRDSLDGMLDVEAITNWRTTFELPPSKVTLVDYNYLQPSVKLLASAPTTRSSAAASLEYYDAPGEFDEQADGERYAQIRMEELDARYQRVAASSNLRGIAVGYSFELTEHPRKSENVKHVVVSTHIDAHYGGYESGLGSTQFSCRLSAMRQSDVYRPQRVTPKPTVAGPETAVVVGKAGEDIYTDEHGRVKVQFHWDREGKKDENSSCWIRVVSPSAGKGWGMISLPRIGQEVVVNFIEGDPDQPLVTGGVYNAQQITPYLLPEHSTVSTLRTRSSPGDVAANFNEIAFEDKDGEEFIRLHAQKDLVEVVRHDAHLLVENDQFRIVRKNLTEEFGGSVQRSVAGSLTESVGQDVNINIGQDVATDIGGKLGTNVGSDVSLETGASLSIKTGAGTDIKVGANLGLNTAANVHIKGGANIVIEAGTKLTLRGPMINIEGNLVSIVGQLVKINSGGKGGTGSGASPKTPDVPEQPANAKPLEDIVEKIADELKKER